ncbi:MAG: BlaI/MecI/CopY family transcriptional regulator [Thermoguttaceae bacterium]
MARPALSKGEMEVARIIWQLGRATVRETHESMLPPRRMDFATVQTYLRRLEAKGYIRSEIANHARVYAPKVRPATVIRETVKDMIDRLFGGEALPLMQHLIEDRGIRAEEISQLKSLLNRIEEEGNESPRK